MVHPCSLEGLRFGWGGGPGSLRVQLGQKQPSSPAPGAELVESSPVESLGKQQLSLTVSEDRDPMASDGKQE